MIERWKGRVHPRKPEHSKDLSVNMGISEITAQLLINRNITGTDEARVFLYGSLRDLGDPYQMSGVREAVKMIRVAINESKSIRIFGDYDVDGVTSTVLLLKFLKETGASVDYYIPHRVNEGYGLSQKGIKEACSDGVSLIISVDCGVSDIQEIREARALGMNVIVVDHHELSTDLPEANVIINPKNPRCPYPFKEFAGVGVVFKLIQGMCIDYSIPLPEDYLALAALGTIGDAVPLRGENRILVREGMKRLSGSTLPGLLVLLEKASRRSYPLTARDLSCTIIPRINAAGRIERADIAVELLMCNDIKEAEVIAVELDELNRQRQKIEEQIRREVFDILEKDEKLRDEKAIIIAREEWHPGVIGITAYRVSESLGKPVFLIALKDGIGRGSARTANGMNLFDAMNSVGDLFLHYGGHFAAGGFSLPEENILPLRKRLQETLFEEGSPPLSLADMEIAPASFDMPKVSELKMLEPFGEGNPEPMFLSRGVRLRDLHLVGGNSHLRAVLELGGHRIEGIAFNKGKLKDLLNGEDLLYDLAYSPEIDTYMGKSKMLIRISDIYYPDPNSHRIISRPEFIFSDRDSCEESRSEQLPPVIIDSRNVANKTGYVKKILNFYTPVIIVARTSRQMMELKRSFEVAGVGTHLQSCRERSEKSEIFIELAFPGSLRESSAVTDILFYSPPPSLSHFNNPIYRKVRRIHFLFNESEIEFEVKLQRIAGPTFEKLSRIHDMIKSAYGTGNFTESEVLAIFKERETKKITVEIALRILKEMGILKESGAGFTMCRFYPITEAEASASGLYNLLKSQMVSFLRFRELYHNSIEELRREILHMVRTA